MSKRFNTPIFVFMLVLGGFAASLNAAPDAVRARLAELGLGAAAGVTIEKSPLADIYQVVNPDRGQVFYIDKTGRFLFSGSLNDLVSKKDLTKEAVDKVRVSWFDKMKRNFITYGKPDAPHRVVVFTDIECGYCQRFHADIDKIVKKGITVDYILVPFRGQSSSEKATAVWCSADRRKALDAAKAGRTIDLKACPTPIDENSAYAQRLQVRGTPAVYNAKTGAYIGGYLRPDELLKALTSQG